MAKNVKRQQPSKPRTLAKDQNEDAKTPGGTKVIGNTEAERQTRTAEQDNADAKSRDLAPTHDPQAEHEAQMRGEGTRPRTKEEIDAGKKKSKYKVLTEGAIFDGKKKSSVGDTVTLTADEAAHHQRHGVGLGQPDEE